MVDNIELNVTQAADKVETANTELNQARTYQSAARKVCARARVLALPFRCASLHAISSHSFLPCTYTYFPILHYSSLFSLGFGEIAYCLFANTDLVIMVMIMIMVMAMIARFLMARLRHDPQSISLHRFRKRFVSP